MNEDVAGRLRLKLAEQLSLPLTAADDGTPFLELGFDSVIATEFIEFIRREFAPDLSVAVLFDHPTLAALARQIVAHIGSRDAAAEAAAKARPAVLPEYPRGAPVAAGPETDRRAEAFSCPSPIAVVGMSGRFPGAGNIVEFWRNVAGGVCSITGVPAERSRYWQPSGLDSTPGTASRRGGFLRDIERFEPLFFGISPKEAAAMDPQQRLFLEEAWRALEDAAYAGSGLSGCPCGVYAGVMNTDYQDLLIQANALTPDVYELMGSAGSMLAARIAYHLNLRGPAITVDTSCSSGLTAVHLACRALQQGEIDLALAGGVTLYLTERRFRLMTDAGMLAGSGQCRPFDDAADGMVPGETAAVLVLKRLADAVAQRDAIYGTILASGIGHSGKTNGITVPSAVSQQELITRVHRQAGVPAHPPQYIETHGTGTKLGDPIEAEALARAFADLTPAPIRLGSVKANIGHGAAAAGLAGLIKVLLALRAQVIPPQTGFTTLNRHIDLSGTPLQIDTAASSWNVMPDAPRRAAVSAFGFSGTNAHVVVQEAPDPGPRAETGADGGFWIVLSARTEEALDRKAADLRHWLDQPGNSPALVDLAFTLSTGRTAFEERLAFPVHSLDELRAGLHQFLQRLDTPLEMFRGRVPLAGHQAEAVGSPGCSWVAGQDVDWRKLYAGLDSRKLHLPGYPFAGENYWYDALHSPGRPLEKDEAPTSDASVQPPSNSSNQTGQRVRLKPIVRNLSPAADAVANGSMQSRAVFPVAAAPASVGPAGQKRSGLAGTSLSPAASAESASAVKGRLRKVVAGVLYLRETQLLDHARLADLGLDSIVAVEIAKGISAEFGVSVPAARLYDHPSLQQLSEYVHATVSAGAVEAPAADTPPSSPAVMADPSNPVPAAPIPVRSGLPGVLHLAARIRSLLAKTLFLEERNIGENRFADLGLDSILAVNLIKDLNAEFATNLSTATLHRYPTTRELAQHLQQTLGGAPADLRVEAPPGKASAARFPARSGIAPSLAPPGAPVDRLRVVIARSGAVDDLQFISAAEAALGAHEIRIAVEAASVMLADLLCVSGLYPTLPPYPFTPGFEVAGTVEAVGADVRGFKLGDRVFGMTGANLGGHAATAQVDARYVARIPETLDFEQACALPVPFLTARHALFEVGRLRPGETVLVHSAGSCTGQMAVQLAQRAGGRVVATVGSADKVAQLRQLGAEEVFNYRSPSAWAELLASPVAGQVNVVLNMLSGPLRDQSLTLLAPGGRFLDLAVAGLKAAPPFDFSALAENRGYFGIDCRRLALQQPSWVAEGLQKLIGMLAAGEVAPLPIAGRYSLRDAPAAYRQLESRTSFGRIVLLPRAQGVTHAGDGAPRRSGHPHALPAPAPGFPPIAVVGFAGRFPDAPDPEALWRNLADGKMSNTGLPAERRSWRGFATGENADCQGGFLDAIARFDAAFFRLARPEAEMMDPQHRLFLQEAWKAVEDAGYSPFELANRACGIFVGVGPADYYAGIPEPDEHSLIGNLSSGLTARLAYHLNWTGPCLAVDTACASSFTALHLACASLHRGECDLALVGGVNLAASSKVFAATKRMGLLAQSGRCRTFDAQADGWVIGEAVAAIVLKPLDAAERDRDHIHGVIRFSGINQDGAKNGLTAPSAAAQSALQRRVYEQSGINPETIDLIEIHGTSSRLGDEIEITALKDTFAHFTPRTRFCALGSLKPNIGHPIAAAGVTCLVKVLLALRHQKIPPVAGLGSINPALQLDHSPFFLNTELSTWKGQGNGPRRAAINGLSATGTNCHLIVEEYVALPEVPATDCGEPHPVLLVLSARHEAALHASASNLLRFLQENPGVPLRDVAFTLQVGREVMAERLALVVASPAEAIARLSEFLQQAAPDGYFRGTAEGSDETFAPLLAGAEGKDFFSALIRNRSYEKLARLWTRGVTVDWRLLYQRDLPRRVPLPTYPFAGEDYWHSGVAGPARPAGRPSSNGKNGAALATRRESGGPEEVEPPPSPGSLLEALRASVAEVLRTGPAGIRADDDLARHGFGSLYALRVAETFERLTGVRIPARLFFEERTLRRIAAKLSPASPASTAAGAPEPATGAGDQPAAIPETFALTEAQKAVWSTQASFPGSTAYHLPLAVLWNGKLDVDRLCPVLHDIAADQPALRITFQTDAHGVMQVVHPSLPPDVQRLRVDGAAAQALDVIHNLGRLPFDLEHGPLWRAWILSGDADRDVLFLHVHHIIFDGRSLELLLSEIERRYGVEAASPALPRLLPERTLTDFAELERGYLESRRSGEDRAFWLNEFPDGFAPLRGAAVPQPSRPGPGELFHAVISKGLIDDLEQVAVNRRVTLQALLLTAFQVVLAQATAAREVVTGIAVDTRPSGEFAQTIGFFVNVLPVRLRLEAGIPFESLLQQTFDQVLAALEHRLFPLRRLVQALSEMGKPAALASAFYFQTWQRPEHRDFANRLLPQVHQTGEFDLVGEVLEAPGDWRLYVKYRPAAFTARDAENLAAKFLGLLETVGAQPEIRLSPPSPKAAVAAPETLEVDPPTAFAGASHHSCVHDLIDGQACLTPEATAAIFCGRELTYQALQQRTNQLAHHLLKLGVTRGSPVGVCVDRSLEMLVSLVAVWKAGAPYVPLDPTYPDERLAFITRDSGMTHLITRADRRLRPAGVQVIDLDGEAEDIQRCTTDSPDFTGHSEDLAYIIYTSGSTGQPKGVQIRQRSLRNFLCSMARQPGCTAKDYVLAATTVCFDIAALELFLPLITGARVEILPEETVKGGVRFREKVERSPATLVQGTPSTWQMLLAADLGAVPGLKILCGGEPWDQKLAGQLLKRGAEVWNMYGPTETTVWSAIQKVEPDQPIRLGEPIANTRFYVLDPSMKPVPPGEVGELWIGGDGLAKGYVNRPDLTRERFVPDPARAGELIYKTGDLVRYV